MALSILIFCAACANGDLAAIEHAAQGVGQIEAQRTLPDLPLDCRRKSKSGVQAGDRLDVALLKTDAALNRQNKRSTRCAGWYDQLRENWGQGAVQ